MKRVFLICMIGMALCVSGVFAEHSNDAFAIGVQGGGGGGLGSVYGGGSLTLKIPKVPIFWAFDVSFGGLGVSADYYFIDKEFAPSAHLGWYLGGGAYGRFTIWGASGFNFGVGVQVPIGLSWHPIDLIEVYLQAVPFIGVSIPSEFWFSIGAGGNLGIRFWL